MLPITRPSPVRSSALVVPVALFHRCLFVTFDRHADQTRLAAGDCVRSSARPLRYPACQHDILKINESISLKTDTMVAGQGHKRSTFGVRRSNLVKDLGHSRPDIAGGVILDSLWWTFVRLHSVWILFNF